MVVAIDPSPREASFNRARPDTLAYAALAVGVHVAFEAFEDVVARGEAGFRGQAGSVVRTHAAATEE